MLIYFVIVFSALRVYALLDRNLPISVTVLLLSLVTTPVEIVSAILPWFDL